jgi:hypothetical protein
VALGEKLIPVHLAAFASVELVNADLNITASAQRVVLFHLLSELTQCLQHRFPRPRLALRPSKEAVQFPSR